MEDKVRRTIMIALIAILALVVAAPLAFAQTKGGAPEPIDDTPFELPAMEEPIGAACTFPVLLEPSGRMKEIDVPERPGEAKRTITIFPGESYTLTNLNEPENTVTLITTGAQHQTTLNNGDVVTVVTGLNLLGDPEAGFVLAKGNFSFVFDKDGKLIQPLEGQGQLTDVCELLS
jgi:hypothetical protein